MKATSVKMTIAAVSMASAVAAMSAQAHAGVIYTAVNAPIAFTSLNNTSSSIQIGGLSFTNFSGSGTGDMSGMTAINVTPVVRNDNGVTTYGFEFSGGFQDIAGGDASDFVLHYSVTSIDPSSELISDAHIFANTFVVGNGYGVVAESWYPVAGVTGGVYQVSDTASSTFYSVDFPTPQTTLNVTKDIQLNGGTFGVATLSFVDQTYSVVGSNGGQPGTPEPASLGILAIGATALLTRRRR